MRLSVSILGAEVFAIELGPSAHADGQTEWNGSTHTNGLFERDTEPLRADRMEPIEWDDRKQVGFGRW